MEKENKIENSLMITGKEGMLARFFKWVRKFFSRKEGFEEPVTPEISDITIPKAVNVSSSTENIDAFDKNSLEYLSKLSDEELDDLDMQYENQMEETKNELLRLEDILQNYKQSIKKMQDNLASDEI